MRTVITISLILSPFVVAFAQLDTVKYEATHEGTEIYTIFNPENSLGGYCVKQVLVNGKYLDLNLYETKVRIDELDLKTNSPITMLVIHENSCVPKIGIEHKDEPRLSEIYHVEVDSIGRLYWCTVKEFSPIGYQIEQYRWNKWVVLGDMEPQGSDTNEYVFELGECLHYGENQFRVSQTTGDLTQFSAIVQYQDAAVNEVVCKKYSVKETIELSGYSLYELYDSHGNLKKRGYKQTIDLSNLPKGTYYLNYDNKMEEIKKK